MRSLEIKISPRDSETFTLECPYHPELIPLMRKLNAKFFRPTEQWVFDEEDVDTVRAVCFDIFGTTGDDNPELVSVRLHIHDNLIGRQQGVFLAGRQIAQAFGRDTGAKLGPKVVVIQGDAPRSSGSMKNWLTVVPVDSVLEIRKLPLPAAEKLVASDDDRFVASIVGSKSPDLEGYKRRREQLIEELADIERTIAGYKKE